MSSKNCSKLHSRFINIVALACISFFFTTPASAALSMFLIIPGISGESVDKTFPDSIEVLAWTWGSSSAVTYNSGDLGGCPQVQDLSLTKWVDSASPRLLIDQLTGTAYTKAELIIRTVNQSPVNTIVLELEDVRISSLSTGGAGGENRMTENMTLNFRALTYTYTNADGEKATPITFDLAACS